MPIEPVTPSEGWGVLHLFFHLRRELVDEPADAGKDFAARLRAFDTRDRQQVLPFSVLGQKADFGVMALAPDLAVLDALTVDLANSPLGMALVPAASYVSLTELSEYTATEDSERARLEDEGLTGEHLESELAEFRERIAAYNDHRLHPLLPDKKVLSFYPMSKRREGDDNWYLLTYERRRELMAGHARVGRTYAGRILQLITGSVGLDDWEWGVTLLSDDPKAIKDIVYEMRFDEVSARYAEFGPFVTGLVMAPEQLMAHHGLA